MVRLGHTGYEGVRRGGWVQLATSALRHQLAAAQRSVRVRASASASASPSAPLGCHLPFLHCAGVLGMLMCWAGWAALGTGLRATHSTVHTDSRYRHTDILTADRERERYLHTGPREDALAQSRFVRLGDMAFCRWTRARVSAVYDAQARWKSETSPSAYSAAHRQAVMVSPESSSPSYRTSWMR